MCNHFYQKMITIHELWILRYIYIHYIKCSYVHLINIIRYIIYILHLWYNIIILIFFLNMIEYAWLWLLSICYVKHKIRATSKKRGFLVFIAGCCAPDHCTWRSTYWLSGARNTLRSVEPGCSIQPPCHMICWKQTDLRNLMTSRHGRLNSADDQDGFEVLHRLKVKLL